MRLGYKEDLLLRVSESIVKLDANLIKLEEHSERTARAIESNVQVSLDMKEAQKALNDTLLYHTKQSEEKFNGCQIVNEERNKRQMERERLLWRSLAIVCGILLFILLLLSGLEKVIPLIIKLKGV